ncbi:hypothetical protein Vadar_026733 [Vaccinium darrowii]|uniref:Uncharacterized protein n=1 Tax=Vaccinium darrowii TaxID=229202 RepID=A0ACB7ZEA7_9ERIC|nr:hypothetical protein Vadar_026733 [Vaccinium darrowii]
MAMRVPETTKWSCVPCNGKAILIKYGMARIRTQATMTHELMHLWIWKQGLALSEKVEEGLCHLISYMWLEQYVAENEQIAHVFFR